jgi:hypothetical protein
VSCLLVSARFESQTVVDPLGFLWMLVEMVLANDVYKEDDEDNGDDDDVEGGSVSRKRSVELQHCLMP